MIGALVPGLLLVVIGGYDMLCDLLKRWRRRRG